MSKIEKLTPEQEALIPVYRDKWIAIGKSCEPCDLEQSKHFARLAYAAAGLKCPENFYLVDSPLAAAKLEVQLLGKKLESHNIKTAINNQIFGYHEAGWLSYYQFMLEVLGIQECKKLEGLIGIAENCGWWAPYDNCVIFQHRHSELHTNENHVLHNESGPAVRYRDGYSVWAISGIRVNEKIVMHPETLTVEEINTELNQDIRSIMINRFGWARYLQESNAKFIDYRDNEVEGTKEALYESHLGGMRLVVTCPTGRIFALGLESGIKTCAEAQVWLGGGRKFNVIGRT